MMNCSSGADASQVTETTDLENHGGEPKSQLELSVNDADSVQLTLVVSEPCDSRESIAAISKDDGFYVHQLPSAGSPKKGYLSRSSSFHEQCRICQQEKEEVLIDLGCKCRGSLAKAHLTCIGVWFQRKGSNRCEICQDVAVNVPPPPSQQSNSYWILSSNPTFRADRERSCFSPLWVAFAILVGGLLLDVLISITFGVSALPVNVIIGVIVVLGLGTALRLALEFCHQWSLRRARVETNVNLGYYPAL